MAATNTTPDVATTITPDAETVTSPFGEVIEASDLVFDADERKRMNDELMQLPAYAELVKALEHQVA